jgi:hypothetical protein
MTVRYQVRVPIQLHIPASVYLALCEAVRMLGGRA